MKLFIGADHNGFRLKEELEIYLKHEGYEVIDVGNVKLDTKDDFPKFAAKAARGVIENPGSIAVLLCGSGQGVCIAANRFKGIRASLVWDAEEAISAKNDDDSNVLCLPARELTFKKARHLVDVWLDTPFAGASRFKRRIKQLDNLE